jgi:hypothetical protein
MATNPIAITVARSADLRLQVITGAMQTRWKTSAAAGAAWTPWQAFPIAGLPPAIINNPSVPITSMAAAQLPTAEGS